MDQRRLDLYQKLNESLEILEKIGEETSYAELVMKWEIEAFLRKEESRG